MMTFEKTLIFLTKDPFTVHTVSFLMLSILFMMFLTYLKDREFAIYSLMSSENLVLVLKNNGRIQGYNDVFHRHFPKVKRFMKMKRLIKYYPELGAYVRGKSFKIEIEGRHYVAQSRADSGGNEVVIFEDWTRIVNAGADAIRRNLGDFDYSALRLMVDRYGNILSCPVRLKKYWWVFDLNVLTHLTDLNLSQSKVEKFIHETEQGIRSEELKIKAFGSTTDVFTVTGFMSDEGVMVVELMLADEKQEVFSYGFEGLRAMMDAMDDGIVAVDNEGEILYANNKILYFFGLELLAGTKFSDAVILTDDEDNVIEFKNLKTGKVFPSVWICTQKTCYRYAIELKVNPMLSHLGYRVGYVLSFRDIQQRTQKKTYVDNLIYRDSLTQLYNRRYLNEKIKILDGQDLKKYAMIMIDCNGLKLLNDTFGHHIGDLLLLKTSEYLKNTLENKGKVLRLSGDEFLIVLEGYTKAEVQKIVRDIRDKANDFTVSHIPLSVSVGYAYHDKGSIDLDGLFAQAEKMMYEEKVCLSKQVNVQMLDSILAELFRRKPWEKEHALFVSQVSEQLARKLGLSPSSIELVRKAGLYHNIGKIGIPISILNKNYRSSKDNKEFNKHSEIAFRILSSMPEYSDLAKTVLHYKERYDGKGVPHGLKGNEIPLASRILAVVSTYHVLTRPDLATWTKNSSDEAIAKIMKWRGTAFDPQIAQAFKELVESGIFKINNEK